MAIEDAAVLAKCASKIADFSRAFRSYEGLRSSRTAMVTTASRYHGLVGQWKNPALVWLRNTSLRMTPASFAAKHYKRLVNYDPWNVFANDR